MTTSGQSAAGPRSSDTAVAGVRSQGEETALRIREAASRLFFERGYHAATVRGIATASGLTVGSVYNYFGGKEELLFSIASDTMADMIDGGRAAIAAHDSAEAQFRAYIRFHVRFCVDRRFEARVADDFLDILPARRRRAVVSRRDEYEQLLRDVLRRGEREDNWTIDEITLIASGVLTMITDVRLWYRPEGRLRLDAIAAYYSDFLLRAFKP